ncbi:exonuclease subunit SbcD [Craterilacuibacter sinensis]|uniref:Nuclease SbcCD subunit D n=1 Tax=Craterilacuibacter sinensis TaxID=2686017 RepID=A0A845BKV0_9NEIS|nr:exonuclease subunit SbcD [Craterilacuibacter sinensis]MXR36965.1 exonuclease subunit SbcD [Craterilacuibacter sinensis]
MKILHTSDWHLGQHFIGKTRQAEHQAFLAWLLEQVKLCAVDVVLVAGDVFDTGAPPSYARELYNEFVVGLHASGATLVVLGGNHDSVATLGESRSLLAHLSTRVVAAVDIERQVLVLNGRNGQPGAVLCAIPFIRARDVLQSLPGQSSADKQLSLQQAIQRHYQAVYALAVAQRQVLGLDLPVIASGHLTTVGASASESVREIYVGALEAFPTSAFPPADYIALGHIHRPQKVGGFEHIRYCGSPIALSFDEAHQQKEVLLVELDAKGLQSVTPLAVPCFQALCAVAGSLESLPHQIAAAATKATEGQTVWLEVMVRSDDYLADLHGRIQSMCEGLPVDVLRIRRERGQSALALQQQARETLDELSPSEVFERRLAQEELPDALKVSLQARYALLLAELAGEDA